MQFPWQCLECGRCQKVRRFPVHCVCGFVDLKPGVGDRLAMGLSMVGITQDRYQALKKRLHLREHCRCGKRQQDINKFFGKTYETIE